MICKYLKRGLKFGIIAVSVILITLLGACNGGDKESGSTKVNYNLSASELAKDFYTRYITSYEKNASVEELVKIEESFMTKTMVEELEIRSHEMEADAILGVQDGTGFLDKLEIEDSGDEYTTVARFVVPIEGMELAKNTYEFHIHFRKEDNKKHIDTYDFIWIDTDADGDDSRTEYLTKYANKEELTEEDKIKMSNQRKYYEDLFEEGYIG